MDEQLQDIDSEEQSSEQITKKNIDNINLNYKIFTTQYDEITKAESLENADESIKLRKTLEFGRILVSQETSLINLLYPMTEFFQELLFLKISRGTNSNSKRYTNLAQSVNRKIPSYASNYSSKEIISALKRLGQIDRKIKTTTINDESIITEFLYATVNNG